MVTRSIAPPKPWHTLLVEEEASLFDRIEEARWEVSWLRVTRARNAKEALALMVQELPDALVCDTQAPDGGQLDLLKELARSFPSVPVVIILADGGPCTRQEAVLLGAKHVIEKPFRFNELLEILQQLFLRSKSILPPAEGAAFEGRLDAIGFADVLQVTCLIRKEARIEIVVARNVQGTIWVRDGNVVNAFFEGKRGLEAVYELAELTGGRFRVVHDSRPVERLIEWSWQELLLECVRHLDEKQRLVAEYAPEPIPTELFSDDLEGSGGAESERPQRSADPPTLSADRAEGATTSLVSTTEPKPRPPSLRPTSGQFEESGSHPVARTLAREGVMERGIVIDEDGVLLGDVGGSSEELVEAAFLTAALDALITQQLEVGACLGAIVDQDQRSILVVQSSGLSCSFIAPPRVSLNRALSEARRVLRGAIERAL